MAGSVSNADLAQQLGRVQSDIGHVLKDNERARDDRERLFERIGQVESAAATAARAAAAAAARIEALQTEIAQNIVPTVQEWQSLKLKAAGAVVVLVFIGSVIGSVFAFFVNDLKRWIGLA